MAQNIRLKRSAVSAKVPATTDLSLGELAINTYDGKMYFKKDVSGTETIIQLANDVDVVKLTGNQTIAGVKTFSDTTDSTSKDTGALIVEGGVGIEKSLYVGENLTVADKIIHLNNNTTTVRFPSDNTVTIETAGTERLRITPSGNLLIGTTLDFLSTKIAGSTIFSGASIYAYEDPSVFYNPSATDIGIAYYNNTPIVRSGTSTSWITALHLGPKVEITGGSSNTVIGGFRSAPNLKAAADTSRIALRGADFEASRYSPNDFSTNSNNRLEGSISTAYHWNTLPNTARSARLTGYLSDVKNNSGITDNLRGVDVYVGVGTASGANTSSATNLSALRVAEISIGRSSGNTATATNVYGLFLSPIIVNATGTVTNYYAFYQEPKNVTGTLTNNWGLYLNDTTATNYIGGNVGIGTNTPTEKLHVSGNIKASGNLILNNGNGIDFSATANTTTSGASMTSELLSDYEEGTWTPTVQFGGAATGITYSTQVGFYTKVGRLVTARFRITLTSKGSSTGAAKIIGLPFTNAAQGGDAGSLVTFNLTFADVPMLFADSNGTALSFFESTNAGVNTDLTDADFANNTIVIGTVTYTT